MFHTIWGLKAHMGISKNLGHLTWIHNYRMAYTRTTKSDTQFKEAPLPSGDDSTDHWHSRKLCSWEPVDSAILGASLDGPRDSRIDTFWAVHDLHSAEKLTYSDTNYIGAIGASVLLNYLIACAVKVSQAGNTRCCCWYNLLSSSEAKGCRGRRVGS